VDALAPAAAALDESAGRGDPLRLAVRSAARAAADGRETAKGLVAQHGKAAVFRDQTIGLEDPGAYVGALVLEAFANVCGSPDDPPRDAPRIVRCGETEVTVMPSRGAIVTRVTVGGVDLLYLDQATLASPTGAIRGGIPLLFPFAGELRNGVLTATGTAMPRHGFARRAAWHVTSATSDRISMHLPFDDEAHAQYPFDCHVHQVVTAISGGVQIDLSVENRDARPLPLAPGWHPYFPCPRDRKRECLAQIVPAEDLTAEPLACDVNVLAPSGGRLTFAVPGIGAVTLRFSAQLKTLEVWTLPDADFVCIEPWVGPSNVINTPDRIVVGVRERVVFSMGIELSRTAAPESD
jgi:galactose mutarotase-like enzyme